MHVTYNQNPLQTDFSCLNSGPTSVIPLLSLIALHNRVGDSKMIRLPPWDSVGSRWWQSTQRWLPQPQASIWRTE